jgi:DNA modification methylase
MKTYTLLKNACRKKLPEQFCTEEEIRMPEAEVEFFIKKYTQPGDKILDIFAGFGTSLIVSEELGRIPYGIEYDPLKVDFVRDHLTDTHRKNIIHGDSRKVLEYSLPVMDFLLTSPPFTYKEDVHAPLTAYEALGSYNEYLRGIHDIFHDLQKIIKPNGFLLVEVSNLKNPKTNSVTTLAWDIYHEISQSHIFLGEIVVGWSNSELVKENEGAYGYGYDHSYCLIFQNSLLS